MAQNHIPSPLFVGELLHQDNDLYWPVCYGSGPVSIAFLVPAPDWGNPKYRERADLIVKLWNMHVEITA